MKRLGFLMVMLVVAGCTPEQIAAMKAQKAAEERAVTDSQKEECASYGLKFGTDRFADCMMKQAQIQTENNRLEEQRRHEERMRILHPEQFKQGFECDTAGTHTTCR